MLNNVTMFFAGAVLCLHLFRDLNYLDVQLHKRASELLAAKRQKMEAENRLRRLRPAAESSSDEKSSSRQTQHIRGEVQHSA